MQDLPVIRTREEAKSQRSAERVYVEVPGSVAAEVLWLSTMLTEPDDSEPGRVVKRLLTAERSAEAE
jgi:hypothetical protein